MSGVRRAVLYLEERLLKERGGLSTHHGTVLDQWHRAWLIDDDAKRTVFLGQLDSLRIRRGVAGRRFDEARVLLSWTGSEPQERAS